MDDNNDSIAGILNLFHQVHEYELRILFKHLLLLSTQKFRRIEHIFIFFNSPRIHVTCKLKMGKIDSKFMRIYMYASIISEKFTGNFRYLDISNPHLFWIVIRI